MRTNTTSGARGVARALLLAALALLPLAGCASAPTIHSDYDTTVSFDGWQSWAWAPDHSGPDAGSASVSLYDARIRRSVETALAAAGYSEVPAEQADFLLNYKVQIRNESDVTVWDEPVRGYHWRQTWRPTHVSVHRYEIGSLILDLVQRNSGNIAWRGWAEAEVQRKLSPEDRDRRIDKAVHDILARFPPR